MDQSSQEHIDKYHCYKFHRLGIPAHKQLSEITHNVKLGEGEIPSR